MLKHLALEISELTELQKTLDRFLSSVIVVRSDFSAVDMYIFTEVQDKINVVKEQYVEYYPDDSIQPLQSLKCAKCGENSQNAGCEFVKL